MDEILSSISLIIVGLIVVMAILHMAFEDDDEEVDKK